MERYNNSLITFGIEVAVSVTAAFSYIGKHHPDNQLKNIRFFTMSGNVDNFFKQID